ncbi:Molybdopterin binding protein [Neofusicoccum parvum]|uniref:Molybdopterin binding protein n=1 Tax=Neofusicoccum parvum TaxID=310453 RepID=A0ACB5S345_9PEZI|nr:Molybdopterin binding protein [Neofusicoccum parvum]
MTQHPPMSQLRAAILIVSETAAKDPSTDKCGDVLKDVFHTDGAGQWDVQTVDIVPDNVLDVQRFVQRWADSEDSVNLIVTSGGTGFTVKDQTPEVVIHGMLAASLEETKLAITTTIITGTAMVMDTAAMRLPRDTPIQILTPKDIKAPESVPAFRASIVDGYAVRIPESGTFEKGIYPVALISHAQAGEIPPLEEGKIARITTGAPLPPHASAVVMVEDTFLSSMTADGKEEKEIEIRTSAIKPGENVREVGSDVQAGSTIMKAGEGITAVGGELGLLASVGVRQVRVFKKPVVGVLSTGDELVDSPRPDGGAALRLGEVRDTNRPTLLTAARAAGFEAADLGIASDAPGSLEETLRQALRRVDVVVTSGGVSMGELDLLKPTVERALGGTIHFGRVSMKPGKPTTFATVPFKTAQGARETRAVFSLPGNPASAVTTFQLFVLPSLHQAAGIRPTGLPRVVVRVEEDVRCDAKRAEYHRGVVAVRADGSLWASSTGGQRSSRIGSFKGANALLCLPVKEGVVKKGEQVEALMMGPLVSDLGR